MKKKIFVITAAVCGITLAACGGKTAPETTAATAAAETVTAAEKTDATEETIMEGEIGMPNPMVEVDSLEELCMTLGYDALVLSNKTGLKQDKYFCIDQDLAQVDYIEEGKDGVKVSIRTAAGTDDNSGVFGVEYEDSEQEGITVHTGKLEETYVAWFTDEVLSYSVTAEGVDDEEWKEIVTDAVNCAVAEGQASYGIMAEGILAKIPYQFEGKDLTVDYEENATTGYSWEFAIADENIIKFVSNEQAAGDTNLAGAPGTHSFKFQAAGEGTTEITMTYRQPWDGGDTAETKVITVTVGKNQEITACSEK